MAGTYPIARGVRLEVENALAAAKTVSAVTAANPAAVTSTSHAMTAGTIGFFSGVSGMVMLEGQAASVQGVSTNAFNAEGVNIVGKQRWNRRGAMVTDRYMHVHHHEDIDALISWSAENDLQVVGIDIMPGSVPIETASLPKRTMFIFGQEGPGLSDEACAASSMVCSIAQFGSTRSINVGVAAGIAMHAWIREHSAPPSA
jgi:tRNA(Leu) C34 or U34 (ribose-2'-O)-methylase TrmL